MELLVTALHLRYYSLILYWKLCNASFLSWIYKWAREGGVSGSCNQDLQYGPPSMEIP